MIVLECLFLTIALCDAAEPGSQDAATPMMQGIMDLHHDIFFFLILILVFVLRILVRALWHLKKGIKTLFRRMVILILFLLFLEFLSFQAGGSLQELIVAHCDAGRAQSDESSAAEAQAAALPEEAAVLAAAAPPDSPEEAPASPEVEIEVESPSPDFTPRFPTELPLMEDATRLEELRERFRVNTLGAPYNPTTLVEVLDKQMQIEKRIETALTQNGFAPLSIFLRRDQIREIVFYHHGLPLPLAIYNRYLEEIELLGARESQPYQKILRAIDTLGLDLCRRRQR